MELEEPSIAFDDAVPEASDGGAWYNTEIIAVAVMLCLFTLIGTFGNGLVVYVYSRQKDKLTSTLLIMVLAATDFLTCLVIVPFTVVMELLNFHIGDHDGACKAYHFLITCNIPFSAFLMAAIAVERYLCICHTFQHAMNQFRAKLTVVGLLLVSFCLGTFTALSSGVHYIQIRTYPTLNSTFSEFNLTYTAFNWTSPAFNWAYKGVNGSSPHNAEPYHEESEVLIGMCQINFTIVSKAAVDVFRKVYTFLYVISFLTAIILYSLIVYSVQKQRRQKGSTSLNCEVPADAVSSSSAHQTEAIDLDEKNNGKNEQTTQVCERKTAKMDRNVMVNLRITAMLFVVTLVFIVAFFPAFLMSHRVVQFNPVVFYMYFAHNVANPFIYSFMNRNFRHDLKSCINCK